MLIRRSFVVAYVAGLAIALPASAQSIPWLAVSNGNWSDMTKWTGGNVPDVASESAVLGLTGAYTVTQNVPGLMLDAIDVTNVDAIVNLNGNTVTLLGAGIANSGAIVNNAGTGVINGPVSNGLTGRIYVISGTALGVAADIVNGGLLSVNPSAGGGTTTLRIDGPVTIGGTGEIQLNGGTLGRAQILAGTGGVLTLGSGQLVRGRGQIVVETVNNGVIRADAAHPLQLNTAPKTNNGSIEAAGGTLQIVGITVTQGASGELFANGTNVDMSGVSIVGGSVDSADPGRVRTTGGTNVFSDVDSTGAVEVISGTTLALTGGAYANDGSLVVNPSAGGGTTTLRIDGPVTIGGTGEIQLVGSTLSRAQIVAGTGGVLTLGAGQLVHGRGQIVVETVNNGVIRANAPHPLQLNTAPKTNNGLIEAAGGTLEIVGITVTQGASGEVVANGTNVDMSGVTIVGGSVDSTGAGVRTTGGTSVFSDVDSTADVEVLSGTTLALDGGYVNDGTLAVNPSAGGGTTTLRIDGPVTIGGTGEIRLEGSTPSRAQIVAGTGGVLTVGAGQLVHGRGQIVVETVNNGVIRANAPQPLQLNTAPKTNNGLIEAAGGTLEIVGITVTQGGAGVINAEGSVVALYSAAIMGGLIDSMAAGIVVTSGGTSVFSDVDSTADVQVGNATTLVLTGGVYTNDASLVVNPSAGGSTTSLRIDGPVTIGGTGEIQLNGGVPTRAQIIPGDAGALTFGAGQTLSGRGQAAMSFTLEGTIAPGIGGIDSLNIASPANTVTWQPSSMLDVELGSASSYDRIIGGSHTINGGTLNVTLVGGYTPALFTTHTVIDGGAGSVVTGKFDSVTGPALPSPWVWKAGYTATDVVVGVTCPSDVNADFIVDIVDFLDFLDSFGSCENQPAPCGTVVDADYNGDTFVDILDFLDFFDAFGQGC